MGEQEIKQTVDLTDEGKKIIVEAVCDELMNFNGWLHEHHAGKSWSWVLLRSGEYYEKFKRMKAEGENQNDSG